MKLFIKLVIAQLISNVGSGMTAFALAIYVFYQEQNATSVSLVTLAAFLPMIVCSPFAGALADKYDRRILMMLGDGISIIGLGIMIISFQMNLLSLPMIITCVLFNSTFSSLVEPSFKATISDILTKEEYSKASGYIQLSSASKFLLAPVLAGILYATHSLLIILWIDIGTFMITIIAVMLIRKNNYIPGIIKSKDSMISSIKSGLNQLIQMKTVLNTVLLLTIITLCVGFYQTLYTPYMLHITSGKVIGITQSVSALGLLITSLYYTAKQDVLTPQKGMFVGLILMSISFLFIAAMQQVLVFGVCSFILFSSLPFINVSAEVFIRNQIKNDMQGRIWGVVAFITQLGYLVAYMSSGPLADLLQLEVKRPFLQHKLFDIPIYSQGTIGISIILTTIAIILLIVSLKVLLSKPLFRGTEKENINAY